MANPTIVPGWTGLLSEDKAAELTPLGGNFLLVRQRIGLINAQGERRRRMRITLKPSARADGLPTMPRSANGVAFEGLRAGFSVAPPGPIPNVIAEGSHVTGQANYVHVKWGAGGARPHALVANWPATGASLDVLADFVLVEAVCGEDPGLAVTAAQRGSAPRFAADLGPSEGRGRGTFESLTFTHLAQGAFVAAAPQQVGVPEFSTAVDIGLTDAIPQNVIIRVTWLDGNDQPIFAGSYGLPGAANANLVQPLTLAVPQDAVTATIEMVGGILNTGLWLNWRIGP